MMKLKILFKKFMRKQNKKYKHCTFDFFIPLSVDVKNFEMKNIETFRTTRTDEFG